MVLERLFNSLLGKYYVIPKQEKKEESYAAVLHDNEKIENMRTKNKCPKCKSSDTQRIIYGKVRDHRPGKAYGGCLIYPDAPLWHCKKCGQRFGKLSDLQE